MPSIDQSRYPRGVVELDTHTDTDWAGDKETRKSVACCHHNLDGCCIATTVRQQGFLAMSSAEAELGGIHSGAKDAVVGGVNNGWKVANSTLGFERGQSATTG